MDNIMLYQRREENYIPHVRLIELVQREMELKKGFLIERRETWKMMQSIDSRGGILGDAKREKQR